MAPSWWHNYLLGSSVTWTSLPNCTYPTLVTVRAGQRSITANLRPLTTHIYHVMIIVTDEFSMKSLLLFLRNSFKQFWTYLLQNSQNKFVFFLSIHFFTCCFVIILCINTFRLFVLFTACKDTGWVCSLFAHCFTITVYINTLHLLYFLHHKWYERKPKALIWPAIFLLWNLINIWIWRICLYNYIR